MSSPLCSVACLLPAENLRCILLNPTQIHTLAIPPVIELFFSLFLIYTTWRSRRCVRLNFSWKSLDIELNVSAPFLATVPFNIYHHLSHWSANDFTSRVHLLLAADGVFYFILALVDQLLYVLPAARNSVATSRVAELFLGMWLCIPESLSAETHIYSSVAAGSVSFVSILLYTSYLAWLSCREFIPYLPRRHQPAAKYIFTGLIPVIGVLDFAASLGMSIRERSNPFVLFMTDVSSENLSLPQAPLVIDFTNKNE